MNRLVCGDCAELMEDLPDGSVDVIFTDPPYLAEFLPRYQVLADHAARLLKPSGFLVTYAGQYHLDRVMQMLGSTGLSWFWMVGQVNNTAVLIHGRKIVSSWKPILVYQKPPAARCPRQLGDMVAGKWTYKKHPWEQAISNTLKVLERLADPGAQVLDPFMGTGTNCLAAKLLGMEYIGFEMNPDTFAMAVSKLEQEPLAGRAVAEVEA